MHFIDDNAIHKLEEDDLGRRAFAEGLGNIIRDWDRSESIVIALYGKWGSGKSSIIDMAVDQISRRTVGVSDGPIILIFNPWHFSDQAELLKTFFTQLYAQVRKYGPDLGLELQTHLTRFGKALGALEAAPQIGDYVSLAKAALGIASPETLDEHRAALEKVFLKLGRRIVIVIDDVDRLTHSEIRHLFQLIKLNANFPNTIYLIAFDRPVVEAALESEPGTEGKGRAYIEKIVQVGFDVPMIEAMRVEEYLNRLLSELVAPIPDKDWDKDRWTNLYHSGFKRLFTSIRDVKRFMNSLSFTLTLVPQEINPVDFIGLEALRVFLPDVYHGIAHSKDLLTEPTWQGESAAEKKARAEAIGEVFNRAGEDEKIEIAKAICMRLFPAIQYYFGGGSIYSWDILQTWRQQRRLCSPQVFDSYFLLGVPKGEISQDEMRTIIKAADDKAKFMAFLKELTVQKRIMRFFDLAQDNVEDLEDKAVRGFVEVLTSVGEELPKDNDEFSIGGDFTVARLIYLGLMKLEANERCQLFREIVTASEEFYQLLFVVTLDSRSETGTRKDRPLFDEECLGRVQQECIRRIKDSAKAGKLINSPHLAYMLFRWRDWGKSGEAAAFVKNAMATREGTLALIAGFVGAVQVRSDSGMVIQKQINMNNLAELADPEQILKELDEIPNDELISYGLQRRQAIEAFRKSHAHWLGVSKKDDFPYRNLDYPK